MHINLQFLQTSKPNIGSKYLYCFYFTSKFNHYAIILFLNTQVNTNSLIHIVHVFVLCNNVNVQLTWKKKLVVQKWSLISSTFLWMTSTSSTHTKTLGFCFNFEELLFFGTKACVLVSLSYFLFSTCNHVMRKMFCKKHLHNSQSVKINEQS